jgi:hypothetical protein
VPARDRQTSELSARLDRLEAIVLRVWQIAALGGVATGAIYARAVSRSVGLACAIVSAIYLVWFVLLGYLHDRGDTKRLRALPLANTAVEAVIPWMFMLVIVSTAGPDYALASWVPPFLYLMCLVAYVPRLAPRRALVLGLVSAAAYLVVYFGWIRPALSGPSLAALINQPPTQVARAVTLAAAGGVMALLIVGLRQVMAGAAVSSQPATAEIPERLANVQPLGTVACGLVARGIYRAPGGFERAVRIIELAPEIARNPRAMSEIRDRARLVARLTHPNILALLELEEDGQQARLVSEQLEGVTLGELLDYVAASRVPAPPDVTAHVGQGLLAALEHAHSAALGDDGHPLRIVHGALGCDSVLISVHGEVKLADLALPRPRGAALPPEGTLSHAGDLYALGLLLWELLLAEPHQATAPVQLRKRHLYLHAGWDAFFLRVLAPDVAARFASAGEMSEELTQLVEPDAAARDGLGGLVAAVRSRKPG